MAIPPGGLARPGWASPASRPASSTRGTGAPAQSPVGSCDQLVIDRQRPLLDQHLIASFTTASSQRAGVLERGQGAVAREAPLVPARELASIQRDRHDLP